MKTKRNKYTFDLVYAILAIGICGLVGFGILHAAQGLSLLLMFIGLSVPTSLIAASAILIAAGISFGIKKKDGL